MRPGFPCKMCTLLRSFLRLSAGCFSGEKWTQLTVEDIPEADSAKDVVFKGNIMPILNKKLISNSLSIVYDLIGKSESKQLNAEISNYLMMAVYRSFRILYSANPKNENTMFSIPQELVGGYCNAAMMVSEAKAQQMATGQRQRKR